MTRDEADLRMEAIEMLYIATNWSTSEAQTRIAERLATWRNRIWERDANACRHVAEEWRNMGGTAPVDANARALRERSAESAELCANRIFPRTTEALNKSTE